MEKNALTVAALFPMVIFANWLNRLYPLTRMV
jgi:hypothetical protein